MQGFFDTSRTTVHEIFSNDINDILTCYIYHSRAAEEDRFCTQQQAAYCMHTYWHTATFPVPSLS